MDNYLQPYHRLTLVVGGDFISLDSDVAQQLAVVPECLGALLHGGFFTDQFPILVIEVPAELVEVFVAPRAAISFVPSHRSSVKRERETWESIVLLFILSGGSIINKYRFGLRRPYFLSSKL